jgi:hypothetical protein
VGGAAIDCSGGLPHFTNCDLHGNHSPAANPVVRIAHATATFTSCRLTDNDLAAGAVVLVGFDSRLSLTGCTLAGQPQAGVVGMFLQNARVAGSSNVFFGLGGAAVRAEYGAAVDLDHATMVANGQGLVASEGASLTLQECLIAFNAGAGILVANAAASVTCCDVFGNDGGNYAGQLTDQTGLAGNITADPLFCDLVGGHFGLAAGSPALPSGNLCAAQMGAFGQECGLTGVPSSVGPDAFGLLASPNPFNPRTTLRFSLPAAASVRLEIIALDGSRVVTLIDAPRSAGLHEVAWDGRDGQGRDVPAGIYLGTLAAAGALSVQRLALVR